jgi:hypothetical protein
MNRPLPFAAFALALATTAAACGELPEGDATEATPSGLAAIGPGGAIADPTPGPMAPRPGPGVGIPIDPIDPLVVIDPDRAEARELERGEGWRRVRVAGSAEDGETGAARDLDDEFYVFNGRAAIDRTAALPLKARQALAQSMARDGGKGSPTARAAGDDPDDDEIIVVPVAVARAAETADTVADQPEVRTIGWCDDEQKTYSKTYSFDKTYNYDKSKVTGSFDGNAHFTARLKGSVTGTVKYKVVREWKFACIPYAVIQRVTVAGNADVLATANVNAEFEKAWSWEKEIAAPLLGTVTLPVVPIPLTFRAPIDIGINAAAKASLTANAQYQANGSFNIRCNSSGCDGSKNASHGFTPTGSPVFGATGKVKVTPWIQGGIRVYIISEWLASAEVGVRAGVPAEVFGYAGNTCGDANNDGVNEWVSAATLDLGVDIDVVAKAKFVGDDYGPWTWNVWDRHLAFWKIAGGGVFNPIFYDQPSAGTTVATMRGKMRPCWPYNDPVTFRITWNDGTTSMLTSHPDTLFSQPHDYGIFGNKMVRIDALSDSKGRSINGTSTDSVYLFPILAPPKATFVGLQ